MNILLYIPLQTYSVNLEIPHCAPYPACGDPLHLISYQRGVGYARVFNQGDVVFFGEDRCKSFGGKWLGDTYSADV